MGSEGKRFSLTALRAFEAVTRSGSISSASESLGVTHAAISQQLSSLEVALGRPLFTRTGRKLVLLDEALMFAHEIQRGFQILDNATEDFSTGGNRLIIGAGDDVLRTWLLPALAEIEHGASVQAFFKQLTSNEFVSKNIDIWFDWTAKFAPNGHNAALGGASLVVAGKEAVLEAAGEDNRALVGMASYGELLDGVAAHHGFKTTEHKSFDQIIDLAISQDAAVLIPAPAIAGLVHAGILSARPARTEAGTPKLVMNWRSEGGVGTLETVRRLFIDLVGK